MSEIQGEAGVWTRDGLIVIVAGSVLSGWDDDGICRGPSIADFAAYNFCCAVNSPAANLGEGLRTALIKSRIGMTREWKTEQMRGAFERELAALFKTRNVRGLFSGMIHCGVHSEREIITFQPLRRKRGGTFLAMANDIGLHETTLSFSAADEDLGEALRECLGRCR